MPYLWQASYALAVSAWIAPALGADVPMSWESFNLKGRVRAVTEGDLADNISPSEPKGTPFHTRTAYFSPDGSILSFQDCVSTCERTDFVWQFGRLIEERHQFENQLPERTVKYVRNPDGDVEEELTFENGNLECTKHFRKGALQDEESEYCGDSLTNLVVRKHNESTGQDLVSWYTFKYDTREQVLETQYNERKVQLDDGTVKTEQVFEDSVRVSTIRDSMGRIVEEVRASDANYHRETHKFESSGREIEQAEWNRDGTNINRRTYVYANDTYGNWIRRTEFFGSVAYSRPVEGEVTVRAIDYY